MGRMEIKLWNWESLVEEIVRDYVPGHPITHEELHRRFGIDDFNGARFEDYESVEALIDAVKRAEFDYMSLIEILRRLLLENRHGYLVSLRGEGYMILPADEQVTFAFRKFMEMLEKNICKTDLIMKYTPSVSMEQQKIDNDTKTNYDWIKQGLSSRKAKIQL